MSTATSSKAPSSHASTHLTKDAHYAVDLGNTPPSLGHPSLGHDPQRVLTWDRSEEGEIKNLTLWENEDCDGVNAAAKHDGCLHSSEFEDFKKAFIKRVHEKETAETIAKFVDDSYPSSEGQQSTVQHLERVSRAHQKTATELSEKFYRGILDHTSYPGKTSSNNDTIGTVVQKIFSKEAIQKRLAGDFEYYERGNIKACYGEEMADAVMSKLQSDVTEKSTQEKLWDLAQRDRVPYIVVPTTVTTSNKNVQPEHPYWIE